MSGRRRRRSSGPPRPTVQHRNFGNMGIHPHGPRPLLTPPITFNRNMMPTADLLNSATIQLGNLTIPLSQFQQAIHGAKPKQKRESSNSRHSSTSWYYYLYSDVEIPEICAFSISKRCSFEERGCLRLHAKCASHWQFHCNEHWYNFREFHSKALEGNFQNPNADFLELQPLDPSLLDNNSKQLLKILGTNKWVANFCQMTLNYKETHFPIRRLATHSSAMSKSSIATVYEWYFKDECDQWIKFGQPNSKDMGDHVPNIASEDIEKHYCTNKNQLLQYESLKHKYSLNMTNMIQTNINTNTEREVRRRPKKRPIKGNYRITSSTNLLPNHWDTMSPDDIYILVTLDQSTKEFKRVQQLLLKSMPNISIRTIMRNQNIDLWELYQKKKQKMMKKNGSSANEQDLFHGTKATNIKAICEENLDWRLHGSNVGNIYGRGTYFSSRADVSSKYCEKKSTKVMLVVKVLVGNYINGNSKMVLPPVNTSNGGLYNTTVNAMSNPTIFVKYDIQEYYPEYVVEFN